MIDPMVTPMIGDEFVGPVESEAITAEDSDILLTETTDDYLITET